MAQVSKEKIGNQLRPGTDLKPCRSSSDLLVHSSKPRLPTLQQEVLMSMGVPTPPLTTDQVPSLKVTREEPTPKMVFAHRRRFSLQVTPSVDDSTSVDPTGRGSPATLAAKWGEGVDAKVTLEILESINEHIKTVSESLLKEQSERHNQLAGFLSSMTDPNSKESLHLKRQFADINKQSNKTLKDLQTTLDQLHFRKSALEESGVPLGVHPKEYVKSLKPKKDKAGKKKGVMGNVKHGIDVMGGMVENVKDAAGNIGRQLKKGPPQRSLSEENLARKSGLLSSDSDRSQESSAVASLSKVSSMQKRGPSSLHDYTMYASPVPSESSRIRGQSQAPSLNQSQAGPANKSHTTSVSSGGAETGRALNGGQTVGLVQLPSHDSGGSPADDGGIASQSGDGASGPMSWTTEGSPGQLMLVSGGQVREELVVLRRELTECRNESQIVKGSLEAVMRDMRTNVEVHRQQMQNSAERVERLDVLVDDCRRQMQREFANIREEFRNLEEKLDYRLTTSTRDLRDNISNVGNALNLLEKRLEQTPYEGRKDPMVMYNNFWNAGLSMVAFLMVILSGCFQLLIRIVNFGATVLQHRVKLVILLVPLIIMLFFQSQWTEFVDYLTTSPFMPAWLARLLNR